MSYRHPGEMLALRQLERVRNFKLHLAAFLVGMSALTGV